MPLNRKRLEAALQVARFCSPLPVTQERIAPQLYLFDTIASTNRTLWDLLEQDPSLPEGSIAIAAQQSAGKGQWGRQWSSPEGGLYLSVALSPDLPVEQSAQLTLCTAYGIAIALQKIPGQLSGVPNKITVGLKWLNDLVLHGRKLGGILTETRIQQERITQAVVGVGINWSNPVPETGINLQSVLQDQPTPLIESLEMLAAITIVGLMSGYQHWQQEGISAILTGYLDLLVNLGQAVTVGSESGTVVGVAPTGELQIRLCCFNESEHTHPDFYLKPGIIALGYG